MKHTAGHMQTFVGYSEKAVEHCFRTVFNELRSRSVTLHELGQADVTLNMTFIEGCNLHDRCKGLMPGSCASIVDELVMQAQDRAARAGRPRNYYLQHTIVVEVEAVVELPRPLRVSDVVATPVLTAVEAFAGEPQVEDVIGRMPLRHAADYVGVIDED